MPLFEYHCQRCGVFKDELEKTPKKHPCPSCGVVMKRRWSPFRTIVDFRAGWDTGLGMYVDTKRQRETELRKRGLKRDK